MNIKRLLSSVMVALLSFGCAKTNKDLPDDLKASITQSVDLILGKDAYGRSDPILVASALFGKINALSNAVTRVKCAEYFVDEMCNTDTSGLSYAQMGRLAQDINIIELREVSSTLLSSSNDLIDVYRARMRITDFLRKMFESVRPKRKRSGGNDIDSIRRRGEWIVCYNQLYYVVKCREARLERMDTIELDGIDPGLRQKIRAEIEKWLGRPVRTIEEIDRDHVCRSEEFHAVSRDEFEPPRWEKCSEHPSSGAIIR